MPTFDPDVFAAHVHFTVERHSIWIARRLGEPGPWSRDPVLATRKFTNVFRILDPGTQFIRRLADPDPGVELMRLFLYRSTGSIPAWEYARDRLGAYPTFETLPDTLRVWMEYREGGGRVFTPAYIVFPGPAGDASRGTDKTETIVFRTVEVFKDRGEAFLSAPDQQSRFDALTRHFGVAEFIAMQTLTDWGYSDHCREDRENDFVVPGPGSRKGARKIAPKVNPTETIRRLRDYWTLDGSVYLDLPDGTRRYPSLMDVQNLLCELSKYVRYAPGSRPYTSTNTVPGVTAREAPWYPRHWLKGTA